MAFYSKSSMGISIAVILVLVVAWTQTASGETNIEAKKKDLILQSSSSDLENANKLDENSYLKALVARLLVKQMSDEYRMADSDREKKSVMLPRIGRRSPIVRPRMGSQKRSIYNPRIGRTIYEQDDSNESSLLSLGDDNGADSNSDERFGIFEDKRAIVNPRIGK